MEKINKSFIILLLLVLICFTCEKGLEPVEGIQGTVIFPVDSISGALIWPDSLQGAFVIIAEFQYPLYNSIDSLFAHLVTYSDPLDTLEKEQDYFIQLKPGYYLGGIVGVTKSVMELLFLPLDSLAAHPEYFIPIGLYTPPGSPFPMGTIRVWDDEITEDIDITVDYDLELPF
ncbi:MAG: hypothetical protein KAT54_04215 [Candidatus Marinimicrobia bacterium]|nr:hypothetical protein [Candidatus Neomarinimicrobiota bacterium]